MQACSIERIYQDNNWYTLVGYSAGETSKIKEWHILCNVEMHEALVRKFREYMKS